jgi:hypothetical protein
MMLRMVVLSFHFGDEQPAKRSTNSLKKDRRSDWPYDQIQLGHPVVDARLRVAQDELGEVETAGRHRPGRSG